MCRPYWQNGGGRPDVAEIYGLANSRLGRPIAFRWLDGNRWPVERVRDEDENRAREILRKYDDKDFSYIDATSFALMERLGRFAQFGFDEGARLTRGEAALASAPESSPSTGFC